MKHNFIKTALMIIGAMVVLSATPIVNVTTTPVQASVNYYSDEEVWERDDNGRIIGINDYFIENEFGGYKNVRDYFKTLDFYNKKPKYTYQWTDEVGLIYSSPITDSKYINFNGQVDENFSKTPEGKLTIKDTKIELGMGTDLSKYITYVDTVDEYLNRKTYYYFPGKNDCIFDLNKCTTMKFTAPDDGVLRVREIFNETNCQATGTYISILDKNGKTPELDNFDASIGDFQESVWYGFLGFDSCKVKKGETYTIAFTSYRAIMESKYEMMFMKTTGAGEKYKENTWNVVKLNEKAYPASTKSTFKETTLYSSMRVDIKEESIVEVNEKYLSYIYEGWGIEKLWDNDTIGYRYCKVPETDKLNDKDFNEYFATGKSKDPVAGAVYYKKDVKNKTLSYKVRLERGSYYLPITLGCTDIAFKYKVTPVKEVKIKSLQTIQENATSIDGVCSARATVYAIINKKTYKATADLDGKFSISIPRLKKGTTVQIYAKRDKLTTKKTKYIAKADPFKKLKLEVENVIERDTVIKIDGYDDTPVYVKIGNKTYKAIHLDKEYGRFYLEIPKAVKNTKIVVWQYNKYKNVKHKKEIKVEASIKFYTPKVTAKKGKNYVTGTAFSKDGLIFATVNGKSYRVQLKSRTYKFYTKKLKKGDKIEIWEFYKGKKSKLKKVTVK